MINKTVALDDALDQIADGSTLAIGGFGDAGSPIELIEALAARRPRELTVISNNAGGAAGGLAQLLAEGCVRKIICSFPRQRGRTVFDQLYAAGHIELEVVPQGTLVERLRCAAAGIGAFYTRTAAGTMLAEGKEVRRFAGDEYVLELPLSPDYALIRADRADRWGNLTYRKSARNFNPVMAAAARTTIAQVATVEALGALNPEHIVTPSVYVDHLVLLAA